MSRWQLYLNAALWAANACAWSFTSWKMAAVSGAVAAFAVVLALKTDTYTYRR